MLNTIPTSKKNLLLIILIAVVVTVGVVFLSDRSSSENEVTTMEGGLVLKEEAGTENSVEGVSVSDLETSNVSKEENSEVGSLQYEVVSDSGVQIEEEREAEIIVQEEVTPEVSEQEVVKLPQADSGQREQVVLAGGCFWCTEAYIQETEGVVDAVSGYAGGSEETATYSQVSKGKTSHREAVLVTFDPVRISFEEVLDTYWSHIDPTDTEGQFADKGFHYTTAIYFQSEEQKETATKSKTSLEASGLFDDPVATIIIPYTTFFEAEEYHQDYYKKSSDHYERYKKASGRAGFIEENWAKEAALLFLAEQES